MFSVWTYEDYVKQFEKDKTVRFIEPMSAHELELQYGVPDDVNHLAELKYDGHRGLIYIGDKNRAFSRRISKKTGWYSENTDCIPHIRDLHLPSLFGTVLDGEFDYGNTSMGVQSVLGSLPKRAVAFQEENGYIPFKAFDILYYKGVNVQKLPLWKRKVYLAQVIIEIHNYHGGDGEEFFNYAEMYMNKEQRHKFTGLFTKYNNNHDENDTSDLYLNHFIWERIKLVESFGELFGEVIAQELEGIMVKPMDGIYEQKRSKAYLKVKGQSTWDCVVMGYTPATKVYDGKELHKWKYWEVDGELMELHSGEAGAIKISEERGVDVIPVTKPHFMGWCGAIQFGVWKDGELVHVGDCKGLAESELENIKKNGDKLIGTVLEVRANGIIDPEKGTLRHPRFEKWRKDKNSEQCDWNSHIRKL